MVPPKSIEVDGNEYGVTGAFMVSGNFNRVRGARIGVIYALRQSTGGKLTLILREDRGRIYWQQLLGEDPTDGGIVEVHGAETWTAYVIAEYLINTSRFRGGEI
jgi:hypothetical protein